MRRDFANYETHGTHGTHGTHETDIIFDRGGYRRLLTYQKSAVIFNGTAAFVRRFFAPKDRTADQMLQAARSGKQNIIEGSCASAVSKETELKLTGAARASLEELLEDYYDHLAVHGFPVWARDGKEAHYLDTLSRKTDDYEDYREFFETRDAGTCANIMICLIHKCNYLLDRQLNRLKTDFVKYGGLRERMTRARLEYRTQTFAQTFRALSHESPESHSTLTQTTNAIEKQ